MAQKAQQFLGFFLTCCLALPSQGASCSTAEIIKNQDGTYTYSLACHLRAGEVLEELDLRKEQVKKLNESVLFYKQGYDIQENRAQNWMNTSLLLDKELQRQKTFSDLEKVGYFLLGVLVVGTAAKALR